MSPCYRNDSAFNLFPRGHFRIPLQCFLKVNGQGLLFPKASARYSDFMFMVFVLKTILFASLHAINRELKNHDDDFVDDDRK